MSGLFYGGLANGFLQGLQAGNQMIDNTEEKDLRKQALAANAASTAAEMGLRQRQAQQQSQLNELKIKTQNTAQNEQKVAQAREKMPIVLESMKAGGMNADNAKDYYDTLATALRGVKPEGFTDGSLLPVFDTVQGVVQGKIPLNDQRVNDALGKTFPNLLQRGKGERVDVPDPGNANARIQGEVVSKEPAGMFESPDHPGMFGIGVRSYVKGADGKVRDYVAPLTRHGTAHPDDPAMLVSKDALQNHYIALLRLQDAALTNPPLYDALKAMAGIPTDAQAQSGTDKAVAQTDPMQATEATATGNGQPPKTAERRVTAGPPEAQADPADSVYARARTAIEQGAPAGHVKARLQQNGYDPSKL